MAGKDDDRHRDTTFMQRTLHLKSVKLRHAHVQKDAARLGMRDLLQEGRAGFIGDDAVSRSLENKARRSAQRYLIVQQMHDPLTAHLSLPPPRSPVLYER